MDSTTHIVAGRCAIYGGLEINEGLPEKESAIVKTTDWHSTPGDYYVVAQASGATGVSCYSKVGNFWF